MATKSAKKTVKNSASTVKSALGKSTSVKKSAAKTNTDKTATAKKTGSKAAAKPAAIRKTSEKEKPKKSIVQIKLKEIMKKGTDKKTEAKPKKTTTPKAETQKSAAKKNEEKKAGLNKIEANIVDEGAIAAEKAVSEQTEFSSNHHHADTVVAEAQHNEVEVTSPKKNVRKIKGYSKEDLEYFKKIILDKRNEIIEQLQNLREQMMDPTTGQYVNENSPYSLHMAEQGTDAMEREKIFLWAQRENKFLGYLDDALHRIENGTYGICIECIDEPQNLCPTCPLISKERLAAVPHSQLCLPVKQKQEKK